MSKRYAFKIENSKKLSQKKQINATFNKEYRCKKCVIKKKVLKKLELSNIISTFVIMKVKIIMIVLWVLLVGVTIGSIIRYFQEVNMLLYLLLFLGLAVVFLMGIVLHDVFKND